MKPLHYEITGRSLFILTLVCVLGAPIVGMAATVASRMFHQLLGTIFPVPIQLLLNWSTLVVLSGLLFSQVIWVSRIQHPWLVGGAGVVYGFGVYLAFLISSSRFLPDSAPAPMLSGWPENLVILGLLIATLLIPNVIQSREPVCEHCRRWNGAAQHVGNVPLPQREEFHSLVDRGQIYELAQWIVAEEQAAPPNLEIYRQSCPACQMSDQVITLKETYLNAQGMVKRKVSRRGVVSHLEARELVPRLAGEKDHYQQGSAYDL